MLFCTYQPSSFSVASIACIALQNSLISSDVAELNIQTILSFYFKRENKLLSNTFTLDKLSFTVTTTPGFFSANLSSAKLLHLYSYFNFNFFKHFSSS